MYKRIRIRSYEVGLHFRDGEFKGLLSEGRHWLFDPLLPAVSWPVLDLTCVTPTARSDSPFLPRSSIPLRFGTLAN